MTRPKKKIVVTILSAVLPASLSSESYCIWKWRGSFLHQNCDIKVSNEPPNRSHQYVYSSLKANEAFLCRHFFTFIFSSKIRNIASCIMYKTLTTSYTFASDHSKPCCAILESFRSKLVAEDVLNYVHHLRYLRSKLIRSIINSRKQSKYTFLRCLSWQ